MWWGQSTGRTLILALSLAASSVAGAGLSGCTAAPSVPHARGVTPIVPDDGGPDGISALPAPSGVHVVVNHHPVHMTLELDGTDVGVAEDDPGVWVVDGQIIRVAVVPRAAIYGASRDETSHAAGVSDAQLLLDHLAWESDWASSELGLPVRARPRECRTARGAECLVSDYDLEAKRRHLLVTTVVNDEVVALASVVPATVDSTVAEARLRAVLETIMPHDRWIDPAQEAVRFHRSPIGP
jgi:hypothetical protein